MEEAPNKRNALASLMDDVFVEILCRLPVRSLFCCKCVCRSWNRLILDNYNLNPRLWLASSTMDSSANETSSASLGFTPLSFLPFTMNNIAVSDCCNGLILCWCLGADGYRYVICNPATQESAT